MKIYLINRADILLFSGDKKLKVRREKGKEFIDVPVLPDGKIVLRAIRKPELSHPTWWLYSAFFWIIGILGFFTPRYSRFDYSLDCKIIIQDHQPSEACLQFNRFINKKSTVPIAAITTSGGIVAQMENAEYVYDKASHRRRIIYHLISWLARIAIVVTICCMIIFYFN